MNTKFLNFKWGDKKLSDFNGEIIREGDLEFFNTPEFSNEIVYPKLGDSSIFLGTQKEGLVLEFTVLLESITLVKYNEFLEWLSIDKKADKLYLDYSSNRYRNVKVNSISRGRLFNANDCGNETLYDIEIDVSFITIGDWAITEEMLVSLESDFENKGSLSMFFDIEVDSGTELKKGNGRILYNNTEESLFWETKTGILYSDSNKKDFFKKNIEYKKILSLPPGKSIKFKKEGSGNIKITAIKRDFV